MYKYKIIFNDNIDCLTLEHFENKVNLYLNDGWQLQGGISMFIADNGTRKFAQSIVYDNEGKHK